MSARQRKEVANLPKRFPPSEACACEICRGYCVRPGWWTVSEALRAVNTGYARRMMLEISPERSFGVLSPAFAGCEGAVASNQFAGRGCNFLHDGLCELYGTGLQPLECRFCHHDRPGQGEICHTAIEKDWETPAGRALVVRWCKLTGVWSCLSLLGLSQLKN